MKKFYLFLAGALMAMPIFAQVEKEDPNFDRVNDPKVIFDQDFESDFDEWANEIIDTINGVWYYNTTSTSSSEVPFDKNWELYGCRTDCVIYLKNGVSISNAIKDNGGVRMQNIGDIPKAFANDRYTIVEDVDDTRKEILKQFGIDAGTHYFQYISDAKLENKSGDNSSPYSNGVVPAYRRCLFVRGLPIEDYSSYRLTLFLKAENFSQDVVTTFSADLMRGYFNSEKPFTTSGSSSATEFTFEKTDFDDENPAWEKITLMSAYFNDSVAERYMHTQYHWTSEQWLWRIPKDDGDTLDLVQIKQPDKFFVRLAFRSDSTKFEVDNISLTKSMIGGVQHYKDKIRVDMGYETNLGDLAAKAYSINKIDAVELPGEYFDVWGYLNDPDPEVAGWYKVVIRTAEYHGDGYLYMWSKPMEDGGDEIPIYFDEYFDTVVVSFTNPVDREDLRLYYTGKKYPMAWDTAWVNKGKLLPGFQHEYSTRNPYAFNKVYSMQDLPPVLQGLPYEENSFGLDPKTTELTLKLSRLIEFDPNATEASSTAFCRVTKPSDPDFKEIWTVKQASETQATFVRPAGGADLAGDYKFEFLCLKGKTTEYGDPITVNYHFGAFDPTFKAYQVKTDWRSEITLGADEAWDRPVPPSIYTWNNNDGFYQGTGKNFSPYKKNGLYKMVDDGVNGDCLFYLSAYKKGAFGKLYTVVTLKAGDYTIKFPAFGWARNSLTTQVFVFPKPAEMTYETLTSISEKTLAGSIKPKDQTSWSGNNTEGTWDGNAKGYAKMYELPFTVDADGEYVIEFSVNHDGSTNYYGVALGNFLIKMPTAGLSDDYVSNINYAFGRADDKITLINNSERNYKGTTFDNYVAYVNSVKASIFSETAPSKYDAATVAVDAATRAMQARMDTVDLYYNSMATADAALAANSAFATVEAYTSLNALVTRYAQYNCSQNSGDAIKQVSETLDKAVANLLDRVDKTGKLQDLLAEVDENLGNDTTVIYPGLVNGMLPEYETLKNLYQTIKSADISAMSDADFLNTYNEMVVTNNAYYYSPDAVAARTRQARELYALAVKMGYDFSGTDIPDQMSGLHIRNAALESVLREAVILQVYKQLATGSVGADTLDLSVLLPNYFFYTEGVANVDMEIRNGVWSVKSITNGNTTAIPDWTISGIGGSSSNWLPTRDMVGKGNGQMDWAANGHAFDGGLRCGPQTSGTITNTNPQELPAGYYWIGIYGYNQTSNVNLKVTSDAGTGYDGKINDLAGGKFNYQEVGKDSMNISGKLAIEFKQTSASGSEFDMRYFIVRLRGLSLTADEYAALIPAQEAKIAELISFADAPVAKTARVQYFNLNGVEVDSPKAGDIVIKRSVENGKAKVEKILVK